MKKNNTDTMGVIRARCRLQSTQRSLENDFNLNSLTFNLNDINVLKQYKTWDDDKKKRFLVVIGGRTNLHKTTMLVNEMLTLHKL